MTKKDKLDLLDGLILDRMIDILQNDGDLRDLSDLSTPSQYIAKNNIVEEKSVSSREEEIKKRVKDANARRTKPQD